MMMRRGGVWGVHFLYVFVCGVWVWLLVTVIIAYTTPVLEHLRICIVYSTCTHLWCFMLLWFVCVCVGVIVCVRI